MYLLKAIDFIYVLVYLCLLKLYLPAQRARQVGIALKHLPRNVPGIDHFFHDQNVPWQRVINAKGMISHRYVSSAAELSVAC